MCAFVAPLLLLVLLQAVRASSAAPYYLDDFLTADGKRFQDGATTANNPTVIALQQARLLHPQVCGVCDTGQACAGLADLAWQCGSIELPVMSWHSTARHARKVRPLHLPLAVC